MSLIELMIEYQFADEDKFAELLTQFAYDRQICWQQKLAGNINFPTEFADSKKN